MSRSDTKSPNWNGKSSEPNLHDFGFQPLIFHIAQKLSIETKWRYKPTHFLWNLQHFKMTWEFTVHFKPKTSNSFKVCVVSVFIDLKLKIPSFSQEGQLLESPHVLYEIYFCCNWKGSYFCIRLLETLDFLNRSRCTRGHLSLNSFAAVFFTISKNDEAPSSNWLTHSDYLTCSYPSFFCPAFPNNKKLVFRVASSYFDLPRGAQICVVFLCDFTLVIKKRRSWNHPIMEIS